MNLKLPKTTSRLFRKFRKIVAERTADLSEANKKLSGIINYCADGIIIVDGEGRILQVNPTCENMVGLSASALCKKKIQEIAYSNVKEFNSAKDNKSGEIFGLSDENSEILLRDYFVVNALSGIHTPVEMSLLRFLLKMIRIISLLALSEMLVFKKKLKN